ncbi:hypothetical protein AGDE_08031 [Angomonas deanei]|nr:hypothetical protein AGDE_08031 [Angomonas deanei]|eukprot:EPY34061.1 hypothetical protein AGDE_08031 [Angomonas deanei]
MIAIYKNQGLTEEEALIVTKIFSKKKHLFANLMMVEELGYSRLDPPTTREALASAGAPAVLGFVVGFMVPLLPTIGNIKINTSGAAEIQSNAGFLSALTLAAGTAVVSCVQTEVFFGAYAQLSTLAKATACNTLAVWSLYGISYLVSKHM